MNWQDNLCTQRLLPNQKHLRNSLSGRYDSHLIDFGSFPRAQYLHLIDWVQITSLSQANLRVSRGIAERHQVSFFSWKK
jgi:hypothetical protein